MNTFRFTPRVLAAFLGVLLRPSMGLAEEDVVHQLAVHPLVVAEADAKEEAELRRVFNTEVWRLESDRSDAARVESYLKSLVHHSCAPATELDDCLRELAKAARASRALFVTLHVYPKIHLVGRVVLQSGEVRVSAQKDFGKFAKKDRGKALRRAIHEFLVGDLGLGAPALVELPHEDRPVASMPLPPPSAEGEGVGPVKAEPANPPFAPRSPRAESRGVEGRSQPTQSIPIAATQQSYAAHSTWKRPVGYGLLGAGVVAGGLGLIFRLQSSHDWKDYNSNRGYISQAQVQTLTDLASKAESEGTAATLLLVGSGALVAGGITLLILDHHDSRSAASVRVIPQPAGILVAGQFR